METALGETEGRWHAPRSDRDLQCHRGSAGLLLKNVTAAAPLSTIIPLVFRQKASVSVICPNIAAMSECLPCARHSSQPCPCVSLRFNPPPPRPCFVGTPPPWTFLNYSLTQWSQNTPFCSLVSWIDIVPPSPSFNFRRLPLLS